LVIAFRHSTDHVSIWVASNEQALTVVSLYSRVYSKDVADVCGSADPSSRIWQYCVSNFYGRRKLPPFDRRVVGIDLVAEHPAICFQKMGHRHARPDNYNFYNCLNPSAL